MKRYVTVIIITLFMQIIISFFTTNRLVFQSQKYQTNIKKFNQLKQINQQLQNQYSQLTSKVFMGQSVKKLNLSPIQKTLDINQ